MSNACISKCIIDHDQENLNENLSEKLDLCAECAEQLFFHMSEKKYCSTEISNPIVFAFYRSLKKIN